MEVLRKAFKQSLDPAVTEFVASINDDAALIKVDIQGSLAHVAMLEQVGLLTSEQSKNIKLGLLSLLEKANTNSLSLKLQFEDVHMNIEKQLEELIGKDALRLHTARSRNDQVALDTRLIIIEQIDKVLSAIKKLQNALLSISQANTKTVLPGYTHMQRAQPVSLAHCLLAFFEMLKRDTERLQDTRKRTTVSPLGAGALAGTSLAIDPSISAKLLGFPQVFSNSIDAVSDRDFVAEFVFCSAMTMVHLSQIAETLIIWATSEFGFIKFHDSITTSSSLMPQKKNPDPIELIRGKTGSTVGELVNVLTTLKALPLGYNRDLQEIKAPALGVTHTLESCLNILTIALLQMEVCSDAMTEAASDPELMSTDLVEYLVLKGMQFREAHETVAQLVQDTRDRKIKLNKLSIADFKKHSSLFEDDVLQQFDPLVSMQSKQSKGGTGCININ